MVKKVSHIGIATSSIAVQSEFYKLLGLEVSSTEVQRTDQVRVAIMRAGNSTIELLEATSKDSPIAKFIASRGEGLHHISIEVEDLEAVLATLKTQNIRLIDIEPRKGADGKLVAFVHPHSTGGVLVELSQSAEGED